ncbi:MOSC domain-containing protein [Nocardioides insulae]|uniref:MOSC domain-containing protein n=1 Tax=Nocardioides insulae TaxID=394734 RepID=UPI0003F6D8EF|nr:MOSC N-terminal beta barrel domain-containing protein [Nocardioides insulae]
MSGTIRSIHRYPVKSMGGEDLDRCEVDGQGLVGDHRFALVDVATGKILSAKRPRRWAGLLDFSAAYAGEPVAGEPLPPVRITCPDGTVVSGDDPQVDEALSRVLGTAVRLTDVGALAGQTMEMVWPEDQPLNGFARDAERNDDGERQVDIQSPPGRSYDVAALHLLTSSSLDLLERASPEAAPGAFDPRRYRPNLVIDSVGEGFVENGWVGRTVHVGAVAARVFMPTVRCVMTTLGHAGLPADRDGLHGVIRANTLPVEPFGEWACLGAYAGVAAPGVLAVGDPVRAE